MKTIVNTSRVAVVGLGQLGSSIAARLKELGCLEVYGVARREQSLIEAVENDIVDAGSTLPGDILPVVDVTFLCLPLEPTSAFVKENLEHFRFGSIVTDIGSTKAKLVAELRPLLLDKGVYFIGGHPMAGSEKSGMDHARTDLYDGKTIFLTPTEEDEEMALTILRDFWTEIGGCPIELDAQRHDEAVARTSHSLHLLAAAVVNGILGAGDIEAHETAAAGGFRDLTRIASSDPDMWTQICKANTQPTLDAIADIQRELDAVTAQLKTGDWQALRTYLDRARQTRDAWVER
jgi:prephenate dehydrogenase